jgi:error-prone DNA polymerase
LRMAMIAAGFTGGEAEELRRAMGFKRSEKRMKDIELKLRSGMERNGITGEVQDTIVQSITSFALYGFPESHAASFALLAYSSAYLKCHYLAAFTAAMLNNQPMGFYQPATLVKDAQRHGLRMKPIDVTCSEWLCKLEKESEGFSVRLGLRYVRGLRADAGAEIVRERNVRAFASIADLKLRVPGLRKAELATLAEIGALNFIGGGRGAHRRDALWQIERVARNAGPLLERCQEGEDDAVAIAENAAGDSPLLPMTAEERLVADFHGTGMTVGPHPMKYHRARMRRQGAVTASELNKLADGTHVRFAGGVIARQRPGTAHGFVFLSLEDETGIANAIITPQLFAEQHVAIVSQQFLWIEGRLQNQDNVVSVKVENVRGLLITEAETASHDFH